MNNENGRTYTVLSDKESTYKENGFIISTITDPVTKSKNGKVTTSRGFGIRKSQNYTRNNVEVEKQPLDVWCTTFEPEVLDFLNDYNKGDKIKVFAFLEPIWRAYKADGTPNGESFTVPDTGSKPKKLKSGSLFHPEPKPYLLKGIKNVKFYPGVTFRVVKLEPDNKVDEVDIDFSDDQDLATIQKEMTGSTEQPSTPVQPAATTPSPANGHPTDEQVQTAVQNDPVAEQAESMQQDDIDF